MLLAHLRNAKIDIVFQSFRLIPTLTAWENVEVPLYIGPLSGLLIVGVALVAALATAWRPTSVRPLVVLDTQGWPRAVPESIAHATALSFRLTAVTLTPSRSLSLLQGVLSYRLER